jgi:hypothetical protein
MAAGLLILLLALPPRPARAAVARVEAAPLAGSILGAPAALSYSTPALGIAPGVAAAPIFNAALSGPAAAPAAAAVPTEALVAPAASVSPGLPAAENSPGTADEDRARSIGRKMDGIAGALQNEGGRAAEDLRARDYAVYKKEDIQRAADLMSAASVSKFQRTIVNAVFSRNRDLQEKLVARLAESKTPGIWSGVAGFLYTSLRTAYFSDQEPGVRAAVSSRLHGSVALFLDRIAGDAALPDAARSLAKGIAARYLTDDRLLTAIAWGRREKDRIADGRRQLAAEVAALPELAKRMKNPDVGATSEN